MPSPSRSNFLISPQSTRTHTKMGRTLLVLLWKHFTVRCRRFIHTPIEYLLPIVYFVLLYSARGLFTSVQDDIGEEIPENGKSNDIVFSPPVNIMKMMRPDVVLYYPSNNLTDELMDKVGRSLKLKPLDHFSVSTRGIFGMSDMNAINGYLKDFKRDTHALVTFENMNGTELPEHLNYTIRLKTNFETQMYQAMDETIGPHRMFGLQYEVFVRLQWAIDSSYLELRSGQPLNKVVSVQEFPYLKSISVPASAITMVMIVLVLTVALLLPFYFLMCRLMEERASGVQELIKMVGVTTRTLGLSHLINVLPGGVIFSVVGAVLLTVSSTPLLPDSNAFLIWLFLFLFFLSIITLAMLGSYATNSTEHTTSVALLMYMLAMVPAVVLYRYNIPNALVPLTGMLPFMPAFMFMTEMVGLQENGLGLTFSTMMTSHSKSWSCMVLVYVLLLLQTALWLALAWYCSLVRPGQYGTALPWNFLCRKEYWTRNEVHPDLDTEHEREKISTESKYFEPLPPNSEVGIEIDNVTKVFRGGSRALSNVSLHVLKGEITVLLGHNGAGKTTLMSIVTGMMSATQGNVYVNGLDTVTQQTEVRSQLGFCPQHNLFFPDLTVWEHVMFFSLLKGVTPWKKAGQASMDLLDQLGLGSKAKNLCHELSGGMKRRLQLAFALAGDATVLVLDEPTAGLDIETRRGLWDLLLSLRAGRTVLLSTHFMEEADALGDRVAALHSGTLRCFATPMHLKKEIDTGYRLSITLQPEAPSPGAAADINNIVLAALPRATPLPESGVRTIAYKLPSRESDKFPALFKKLENEREKLGIESIGVGVSTLEEVFLKLCSDVSTLALGDEIDATLQDHVGIQRVRGVSLWLRQFNALFVRQIRYALQSWKMYAIMQIILPIFVLSMAVRMCNDAPKTEAERNPPAAMNFDVFRELDGRRALARLNVPLRDAACCGLSFAQTDNIPATLIDIAREDKFLFNKYVIGIELNETNGVAHFTTAVRHALPVAVNALANALGAAAPPAQRSAITTRNHPLEGAVMQEQVKLKEPKSLMGTSLFAVILGFFLMAILLSVGVLPSKERLSSTRHIHVMSGCNPELHWLTTLLFHTLYSVLVLIIPTIIFAYTLEKDNTISQPDFLRALVVVAFLGCLAFMSFTFLVSFMMNDKRASAALIAVIIIFGYVIPSWKSGCDFMGRDNSCSIIEPIATLTSYTMPPHTFAEALMKTAMTARLNAWCDLNKDRCPNLDVNDSAFDVNKCCVLNVPQRCYLCNEEYSAFSYIWILLVQFIVLMILVFLWERGVMSLLHDRLLNSNYKAETQHKDELLEKEQQYVEAALNHPQGDAMLVSSVHKRYAALMCGNSMTAVKGISFSVREGECFGLVGVNGAGKSTTFKMMTCETFPTRGTIVANGHHQNMFNNSKYLNGLGYCPQFFSLDGFLTGRQNMELLLTLEGLTAEDVKKEAVAWLELIDLMKHADKKVSSYSGGCSRRLCSVAALARRAALSLLDEPTAGVDVAARRQLWRAVRAAQAQTTLAGRKRAVLITSHSMDEMEALCWRVGIVRAGRLAALGAPAALRAAHAAGLALCIKVREPAHRPHQGDVTDSAAASPELQKLKEECLKFQWTPKDEHKTMLNYHVDKKLKMEYSELFTKLEKLRKEFPGLVEDYAVTETTLEQVFLQYAKPETVEEGKRGPSAV